jgi:hypothetical protein
MRKLKHLPIEDWPEADRAAIQTACEPGDIFDESPGPGTHHSEGWRRMILTTYRRWLGFLAAHRSADLLKPPVDRITPQRIRDFIEHIEAEVRPMTVSMAVAHLHCFARLVAPTTDCCTCHTRRQVRSSGSGLAHARSRNGDDGRSGRLAAFPQAARFALS